MGWRVEVLDQRVSAELNAQPADIQAAFLRVARLIESVGLERVREPYVKHLEGPLWEMRMKGKDGIARAAYVTATGYRVVPQGLSKEDPEDASEGNRAGAGKSKGCPMSRKFIPVEELAREWRKDPEFVAAYDALEDEFALATALIEARSKADMTQSEVAAAMGTTQAVVARLEGGRSLPSTRTLQRYAKATNTNLRIKFEPKAAAK